MTIRRFAAQKLLCLKSKLHTLEYSLFSEICLRRNFCCLGTSAKQAAPLAQRTGVLASTRLVWSKKKAEQMQTEEHRLSLQSEHFFESAKNRAV